MSDVEQIKMESRGLRGTIDASIAAGGVKFEEGDLQLIKFHGIYQQDDRDVRQERKKAGLDPAYSFMVRSRIPGGALDAEQYLVHDALADSVGNGSLRLTTRQAFQLHGVVKGNLKKTISSIRASLLSTIAACGDVNRNVMACPAPARTDAHRHAAQLAEQLSVHFTPRTSAYAEIWVDGERIEAPELEEVVEPIYGKTYLPRKFKMAVAVPGDNCVDIYTQDIGFVAIVRDHQLIGYTLLVGGGMGMTHGKATTFPRAATPLCFVTPSEAIEVAEAILTAQRDFGDRTNRKHARLKYVVEERGIPWLRAEVERRLGRSLALPVDFRFNGVDDHLGWHAEDDGTQSLGVHVQNGRLKGGARAWLRSLIERYRPNVRLTPQQNILLLGLPASARDEIEIPEARGVRRYAMACPALPTCGLAVAEAERVLPDVVDEIVTALEAHGLDDEPLSIRMTGCPNGCARPYMGDVGFVGRSKGLYDIFLGGDPANTRLNWVYKTAVRLEHLPSELVPLFAAWAREREADEAFGEYCTRVGRDALLARALPA